LVMHFACPSCGRPLVCQDDRAGKYVYCPSCRDVVKAPANNSSLPPHTGPTSADWLVQISGLERGPFTLAAMQEMARSGKIRPDTLVRQGGRRWGKASESDLLRDHFSTGTAQEQMLRESTSAHGIKASSSGLSPSGISGLRAIRPQAETPPTPASAEGVPGSDSGSPEVTPLLKSYVADHIICLLWCSPLCGVD
jgi:hypothetical protein